MYPFYLRCSINYQFDITEKKIQLREKCSYPMLYFAKEKPKRPLFIVEGGEGELEDFGGGGGFDWSLNLSVTDDNFKI